MTYRTFELGKLVRDGIVEATQDIGGEVLFDVVAEAARPDILADKIIEEGGEFRDRRSLDELVDVYEALLCATAIIGISEEELIKAAEEKRNRVGSFMSGHFVHTVSVPADSEVAQYYASNPERFREIT